MRYVVYYSVQESPFFRIKRIVRKSFIIYLCLPPRPDLKDMEAGNEVDKLNTRDG